MKIKKPENLSYSIYAAFNQAKKNVVSNKELYNLICCTLFANSERKINLNNTNTYLNNLGIRNLLYVNVVHSSEIMDVLYKKSYVGDLQRQISSLTVKETSYNYLFTLEGINRFFINPGEEVITSAINPKTGELEDVLVKSGLTIFHFNEITWRHLLFYFRIRNIVLSGGSSAKRQVLSPLQFKLAIFMLCSLQSDAFNWIFDTHLWETTKKPLIDYTLKDEILGEMKKIQKEREEISNKIEKSKILKFNKKLAEQTPKD
jgi:hypothetical protein